MAETTLKYKCEKHGNQNGGLNIALTLADGQVHSLSHCLVCVAEMLARNGVLPMTPVLVTEEAKTADEFPPLDLGR